MPFTYRYMPVNQYLKRLIDEGYLGEAFHLGLRYFTGFARHGEYAWRFDRSEAGSGVIGDIGSHFLYLARWFFGEVESIGCLARSFVSRDDRPDGQPYERGEDSAVMTLEFASGAYATVQASAVCHEPTPFGQVHEFDAHGSAGTLHAVCDWDTVQHVRGVKVGESGPAQELPIPDDIWNGARRDTVHDTYRDIFCGSGARSAPGRCRPERRPRSRLRRRPPPAPATPRSKAPLLAVSDCPYSARITLVATVILAVACGVDDPLMAVDRAGWCRRRGLQPQPAFGTGVAAVHGDEVLVVTSAHTVADPMR